MNRIIAITIALATVVAAQVSAWGDAGHQLGHDRRDKARASTHAHAHWLAPAQAQATPNPILASSASILTGARIYREYCVACHGTGGRGNGSIAAALETAPVDLMQFAPSHSDGDLAWRITNGRGEMPGWGEVLTPDEIWHSVNFLKHLSQHASIASEAPKNRVAGWTHVD